MEGLSLKLKAQHSNIDFKDFNDLVRKSIKAEYNLNALEGLRRITARGLPLLPLVVAQAVNVRAQDLLLHPGFRDLVLLNQCGWHAVLRHHKGNLPALVDSREAVVGILLLPSGCAIIVAGMDISLASAPLPRKMEGTMLPSLLCLLHLIFKR
jgi:hypothetical protein